MAETRTPAVGDVVVYHEPDGTPRNALVQTVWNETMLNVAYLSGDENRKDQYGRQIMHATSCQHKSKWEVHGNYWRFTDEMPNKYVAPMQA
jgi:hypothetical protein